MNGAGKRLWAAVVDHKTVPGSRVACFFQRTEPSQRSVKARFRALAKPSELDVVGVFDLSAEARGDVQTFGALTLYGDRQNAEMQRTEYEHRCAGWAFHDPKGFKESPTRITRVAPFRSPT